MSDDSLQGMTSNRPYLIRAIYEWIGDNGMTPHLLVDATAAGVQVPHSAVRDGKVILNVAPRAVSQFEMGNEVIHFLARFGGVSQIVEFPVSAVQAIYAQETGQGMMLPPDPEDGTASETAASGATTPPEPDPPPKRGAHLRVIK